MLGDHSLLAHWHRTDWRIHLSFSERRASLSPSLRMWHCESQLVWRWLTCYFFLPCTVYVNAWAGICRKSVCVSIPIRGLSQCHQFEFPLILICLYDYYELWTPPPPPLLKTPTAQPINSFWISFFGNEEWRALCAGCLITYRTVSLWGAAWYKGNLHSVTYCWRFLCCLYLNFLFSMFYLLWLPFLFMSILKKTRGRPNYQLADKMMLINLNFMHR